MEKNKVLRAAIDKWGSSYQMQNLVEECAELIVEIQHYPQQKGNNISLLLDELADVEIMCEQMRLIFGDKRIDKAKDKKLTRLAERLGLIHIPYGK